MADLDDFFAKKDRKKSKSTKKFATTTEELVKKIEDTSARTAKSTEVRAPQSVAASADGSEANADDGVEQVSYKRYEGGIPIQIISVAGAVCAFFFSKAPQYV